MIDSVVPAKAGTWRLFGTEAEALGPRFRGDDEFRRKKKRAAEAALFQLLKLVAYCVWIGR